MRKTITLLTAVLLVPAFALAASGPIDAGTEMNLGPYSVSTTGDAMVRTVSIPLNLDNPDVVLVAMDIPLSFGEQGDGINLIEVTYASRVDYFDVKVTDIDNDNKTVIIGLIAMATDPNTPDLSTGKGPIAYLTFEVTDNTMEEFTISAIEMERPSHRLMYVSHDWSGPSPEVVWEEQLDFSQNVVLSANAGPVPSSYTLEQNYPNPFNAGTVIRFSVPGNVVGEGLTNVRLTIYNVLGQSVRSLVDEPFAPGFHQVSWDGTSDNGTSVASGMYFYRVQAGSFQDTKKMTLLK